MKRLTGFALILISFTLSAQVKIQKSPLNKEFTDYIDLFERQGHKKSTAGYGTGYVPPYLYLHFNPAITEGESRKSLQAVLPARFDQRDSGWVTPARDQGPLGACWSFSTMGALETRFIRTGKATLSVNLSEQNMATCHGFQAGIDEGGSDFIASAYLSRLSGPVTEASDPYVPTNPDAVCGTGPFVIPAYSPRIKWLPNDINIVKKVIRDFGSITTSIHIDNYTNYYNSTDYTFYYNGTGPVDHGVLIVGWDDNKTVTGGISSPKGTKGAWIVKNSWGTSFGQNGFFYVSYNDTKFLTSAAYFPDIIEKSEIDTLYMNDWLGATSSFGFLQDSGFIVEKFVAPKQHFIRKIGTFINSSGTVIDIDIFREFQGDTLLKTPIASSHGNVVLFPGYETFDIPALVNGNFYVRIKYKTPGYNYPIPVETKITYLGKTYALPSIRPKGTSWISRDGMNWSTLGSDVPGYEADVCARIYADTTTNLNAYFTVNKTTTCINSPVTYTHESNGAIDSIYWDFGKNAIPSTANTAGPHNVTYTSTGKKNVTLTIKGGGNSKILLKSNYIEVVDQLEIFLPYSTVNLVKGKNISITAFGADSYSWSPSAGLNKTTGATVVASPQDTTTYTVNGTLGTCNGSSTIKINVLQNPSNDNVCDAIMLHHGYNGPFTNVNATVESNEPMPDTTACNTQNTWCEKEGGLQCSVWFTFVANQNIASFTSRGMDTQIALYDAATCKAILSGAYTILAANDDYFGKTGNYAAALNSVSLVQGKTYFLQMDGSAGGEEGQFTIEIWNAPLGESQIRISELSDINIFPNPTSGQVRVYLKNAPRDLRIMIIDMNGKVVMDDPVRSNSGVFDRQYDIPGKGLYLIKVSGSGLSYSEKIVRE